MAGVWFRTVVPDLMRAVRIGRHRTERYRRGRAPRQHPTLEDVRFYEDSCVKPVVLMSGMTMPQGGLTV